LVSQNRIRFTNSDFNLDLAYITKRVIAMGFPAQGLRSIYRNPLEQVLEFFKKNHGDMVKIYNLCDDRFIDINMLSISNTKIRVAYFPMMDHNPGPVKLLFYFIMDLIIFLASNENNVAAVHCKAGKGRTGVAICAYLIFMEAANDAYEAIDMFNKRRTSDGKGLGVASQKRYLHYFE
jgi:phosphatidylinositol-3,4,5-trisphosphate 3-phosphatase/dual-specificity protein phosphatase PTEN